MTVEALNAELNDQRGVGGRSGEIWLSLGGDQRNALRKIALGRKGVP